jgi:tetratricopeptide (TPR) repeat protein
MVLAQLERFKKALASFDQAIQLDPEYSAAWSSRGSVLSRLERYEEALAALDKAIGLDEQIACVFFLRIEMLLRLNRWDECITVLDKALHRFARDDEHVIAHTKWLIYTLFSKVQNATTGQEQVDSLVELYSKYHSLSILGYGLVWSIQATTSPKVSNAVVKQWRSFWQPHVKRYVELQLPFDLLKAAVRYRETHNP